MRMYFIAQTLAICHFRTKNKKRPCSSQLLSQGKTGTNGVFQESVKEKEPDKEWRNSRLHPKKHVFYALQGFKRNILYNIWVTRPACKTWILCAYPLHCQLALLVVVMVPSCKYLTDLAEKVCPLHLHHQQFTKKIICLRQSSWIS